jgi:hypothetical protein
MVLTFLDISALVLLAGLIAGELYLFLIRGRPIWLRMAYFSLLVAVWFAGYHLHEPTTPAQSMYPLTFAMWLLLVVSVPVAAFAIGLEFASKLRPPWLPHVALAILALAIALVWPSFALILHCGMLECF